ncbi:unnamed protein product [Macrosiphum euphorbiae]|uniref:Uncharacterized protein n=1 Tax=Macrosiphum euphorbiae TaxID=13131 RepID=A0AAV0VJZ2_9HEMI|nr:unnamed protein product [Macrosiphum euphorbiae]
MSELPKDMDLKKLMDEIRSLHLKVDHVTNTLGSLDKKINDIAALQQIGGETVRKSANSINIIIRFLAGLRKLSPEELKNTLVEGDAILNTVNPIPTGQSIDEALEWNDFKEKLKTTLKEVFDLLNSLPIDTNSNGSGASTNNANNIDRKVEEEKIQFWRKYKNKYNYIDKLKPKLPPINNPVEEVVSSIQNEVNSTEENDKNPIVQNNLNSETTYTINDIIQNKEVYEMFKKRLKNSPYDDPVYKNNVVNSKLTLTLANGETYIRPVSHVAPLIVLKKCDDLCPIPLHKKKRRDEHFPSTSKDITNRRDEHFPSTSKDINDSSSKKTKDITNR